MKKSLFLKLLLLISFSGVIIPTGLAASSPGTLKWKFTPEGGEPALSAAGDIEFQVPLEGPNEYSCPGIAADGTIYFGSHDNHVYAMNPDGTVKWRYRTGHRVFKTAVIDADGTIYIGSDDCFLYALDPDGQLKWRYRAGSWFNSPLLGEYGSLYAGSGDGYLYALERNGSLKWKFYAGNYVRHGAVGSDGTIYFGTFLLENRNDQFFALNPDGTVKWRYPLQGGGSSAPAIGLDGTIYFTSQAGSLIALNSDGTEKWSFPAGSKVAAAPVIAGDGTIYFGSYDAVFYAVNPDGTLKWRYFLEPFTNLSASSKNLPQGFDDFPSFPEMFVAAAVGADGTIYFGATDDNLYALSPLGELKWKFSTGGNVNCPPAIDRNGIIYFGSMDRNFYALDSGTEAGLAESPWPKFSRDMVNSGRSDYVEVPFGRLTVDSVLTAFDSSFTVGIGYQVVQATAALELSLEFDNQSIRADSVSLTDRTKAMTILALDIDSANVSGSLDLTLIDLSLTNPISGSTGELVNVHFTEIKNIVQVLELRLSNYAGSTPDGTHIDLTATAGTVIIKNWGIHLTQVHTICSICSHGGLPQKSYGI